MSKESRGSNQFVSPSFLNDLSFDFYRVIETNRANITVPLLEQLFVFGVNGNDKASASLLH